MIVENAVQLTEAVVHEMRRLEDTRLHEILESLVRHLHGFAREVELTEPEFDAAIRIVAELGQKTTASHNEVRLMAGSLGLSTLVCLINNGEGSIDEEKDTSANLLGPFWRKDSPVTPKGGSIVRSSTQGDPMFFTGVVVDRDGQPVTGAEVDVWHASTVGLYENQDPAQAEMNLRGKFFTDDKGEFAFRSIKPAGYPVPQGGPVGRLLAVQHRHPFRPAHLHCLIHKEGFKTIASQLYSADDPNIESDAQFGVTRALIARYERHKHEPAPDGEALPVWWSLEHRFVLEPGEAWLPTPPVSAKAEAPVA
ncbi:MAG: dioxygenase [Caulobacteraceae bacterium]